MEHLLFKEKKKSKTMKKKMMITSTTTKTTKLPPTQSIPTLKPLKLYHNPIFTHHHHPHPPPPPYDYHHHLRRHCHCHHQQCLKMKNTELESARAQITELKAELELERKLRKHVESVAKKMAKELAEVRRSRESAERLCDKLEVRVSNHKGEIERIEREMEKERRMLRIAEVIREERVQMKLEDAKLFYEEKMIKLEQSDHQCIKTVEEDKPIKVVAESVCKEERKRPVSVPPENPHIKRGIKGFVEFPRVLKTVGSNRSNRNSKVECQKAQLRILLKQRSLIQPNTLAIT